MVRASRGMRVVVAGGGALGAATALALAQAGVVVTLCDPAPAGANASGVAAGMLAPVLETALDPQGVHEFSLLAASQAAWPALAARGGVTVDASGGLLTGDIAAAMSRLAARDAEIVQVADAKLRTLAPDLAPTISQALFAPSDGRLSPAEALPALHRAAAEVGCDVVTARIVGWGRGGAMLDDGSRFAADRLVLATGAAPLDLAPELANLTPIKGHILRFAGGPSVGPVLRGAGVYVRPDARGAMAGATMQVGVSDLAVEPEQVEALRAAAAALVPSLRDLPFTAAVGVRAASPDGLPMAGFSDAPGVLLAGAARRNGWLIAPLVAGIVRDLVLERDAGPFADLLDPRRFN